MVRGRSRSFGWAGPVLLGILLLAPSLVVAGGGRPAPPVGAPAVAAGAEVGGPPPVAVNLSLGRPTANLSPIFWGTTISPRARLGPEEGDLVNATPVGIVVWPGANAGDDYDPLTNLLYEVGSAGRPPSTNLTEFVAWCRSISCTAIFQVPGEIDNASFAAADVNYTEHRLGFFPAYWEIGNEPELWRHWGLAWSKWSATDERNVTPVQYAEEVHNYTAAMRAVDPAIRILGLPGTGRPNGPYPLETWVAATVAENARNLSGIAFHVYPAGAVRHAMPLDKFYASIDGPASLPARVESVRGVIRNTTEAVCPTCAPVPVFVTEVGSALAHFTYANDSAGFPGALDLAAQAVEAMDLNLTNLDLFAAVANTSNSWFDLAGTPRPDYTMYSQIFPHLGTEVVPVGLGTPDPSVTAASNTSLAANLYGVATRSPADRGRSDLLVLNLNTTTAVAFSPELPGIRSGEPAEVWSWSGRNLPGSGGLVVPRTPAPTAQYYPHGLPGSWTLPPQGVVVFEAFPGQAHPAQFLPSGIANGTRWFLSAGGRLWTENGTGHLTVFLRPGTYAVAAPYLPAGAGGRYAATLPASVTVGNLSWAVAVPFALEWPLRLTVRPAAAATVVPNPPSWLPAGSPETLTAVPAPGFLLERWIGSGPGNFTGASASALLNPRGPLSEELLVERGYPVAFSAVGLPPGTPWSVVVRGQNWTSSGPEITAEEPNGTIGFAVGPVPGYRSEPARGSFAVTGGPTAIGLVFLARTPPTPEYPVLFAETGLPAGTAWSLTVRNVTLTTTAATTTLAEADGQYGYAASTVPGYRAAPGSGFTVAGGPVTVPVRFLPVTYPVIWEATGLPANGTWSVAVGGSSYPARGDWVTAPLGNGSYAYAIPSAGGFVPEPARGSVVVAGAGAILPVLFERPMYGVTFLFSGSAGSGSAVIRLASRGELLSSPRIEFLIPNGTYDYDLVAPTGILGNPSRGNITVAGAPVTVRIALGPRGPPPAPPMGALLVPAAASLALIAGSAAGTYLLAGAVRRRRGLRP